MEASFHFLTTVLGEISERNDHSGFTSGLFYTGQRAATTGAKINQILAPVIIRRRKTDCRNYVLKDMFATKCAQKFVRERWS